ncbi:MAG: hypothetical protein HFI82_08855 [Eubacterium sp.]|nr:hypothetical protein [Eubacterium sp.]
MFVENKTTEFKREYVEDIKNTIVAFANCDEGTVEIMPFKYEREINRFRIKNT